MRLGKWWVATILFIVQSSVFADPYIGVAVGHSKFANTPTATQISQAPNTAYTDVNLSESANTYTLYFGYEFLKYYAFETGFVDLGKYSVDFKQPNFGGYYYYSSTADVKAYTMSLKASKAINGNSSAYFKVGRSYWRANNALTVTDYGANATNYGSIYVNTKESGHDAYFAFGMQLKQITIEMERLDIGDSEVDLLLVGMSF